MTKTYLILVLISSLFISCSTLPIRINPHNTFKNKSDYKSSSEIYKNEDLLNASNYNNTRISIDISDQRAQLYVNEKVALDTPCCTGRSGKRTPTGNFKIKEKIKDKRSTIFGRLYKNGKQVYGGDRRKYKGSSDRFVGSSLPYWMRLTGDGIGMHYSKNVKRYPASAGCIRMPMDGVKTIYSKVRRGTPVTVQR